ncbi:MAG: hypothetical protein KTR32_30200 [Granulosicoccus sp.]|nr:hypothetical protein [Granulosicoccus sp.]
MLTTTSFALAQQSVMVAGDSISAGFQRPSYRQPLLDDLAARGCTVDMVGNQNLNSFSFRNPSSYPGEQFGDFTPASGYDVDHQSWPGITAGEFDRGTSTTAVNVNPISAYVTQFQPNFVLVHLGTNDLSSGVVRGADTETEINSLVSETTGEVRSVVNNIIASHSNPAQLRVLVANVIPFSSDNFTAVQTLASMQASSLLTQSLESMVSNLSNPNVLLVDVERGFDINAMTTDGVHPNAAGERHMADAFRSVLINAGLCKDSSGGDNGEDPGGDESQPEMIEPVAGSELPGSEVTFRWVKNDAKVSDWYLRVGDTPGGNHYADRRFTNSETRSFLVTGLPLDGREIHAELSYKTVGGNWTINRLTYRASDSGPANQVPVAVDDIIGPINAGESIVFNVLENDSDSDGELVRASVTLVSGPSLGSASVDSMGQITYQHDGSRDSVQDSLRYTVTDNDGAVSNIATVSIGPFQTEDTPSQQEDENWENLPIAIGSENNQGGLSMLSNWIDRLIGQMRRINLGILSGF